MFEKLSQALKKTVDKVTNAIFPDKGMVDSIIKELQRALIEADVNVQLVKQLSDKIRQAALDERIKNIEKKEHIIKLLHDSLLEMLGGEKKEIVLEKKTKIMLLGLYGQGKTTTISKLALYYQKRGRKVACLGLDVHRPAATDQLEQLCKKLNIPCFINKTEKNPIKIYKEFKDELEKYDLLLIDTAGRDALSKDLIEELEKLEKTIKPEYKILVMSADIGQSAKKQADEFKKIGVNGVIITRMDSTAKGGGALTACHETNSPVFFIGTGEKAQDLEQFNPASFISRMLGMGDLESLIEKVKSATSESEQEKLQARLKEGKFTLLDLYEQLKSMNSMGSLDKIMELIPGLGNKVPKEMLGTQENKMKKWKNAIDSMTLEEIENPEVLEKQTSRLGRIAKGSGTTTSEIRALIKQYKMLKELVKGGDIANMDPGSMNQAQMMKLAKKFGRKMKF